MRAYFLIQQWSPGTVAFRILCFFITEPQATKAALLGWSSLLLRWCKEDRVKGSSKGTEEKQEFLVHVYNFIWTTNSLWWRLPAVNILNFPWFTRFNQPKWCRILFINRSVWVWFSKHHQIPNPPAVTEILALFSRVAWPVVIPPMNSYERKSSL